MHPSKANIDDFMAFAPGTDAGTAALFLETANSVNEAVNQYYDNPHKHARRPPSSMSSIRSPVTPVTPVSPSLAMTTRNSISPTPIAETRMRANSPPPYPSPPLSTGSVSVTGSQRRAHTNGVTEAAKIRARDEQEMQNMLQTVQQSFHIYNSEIEPEHETDYACNCLLHRYMQRKMNRLGVLELWSKAVMYPGEKHYHDCSQGRLFSKNPYQTLVVSPYGFSTSSIYGVQRPDPHYHAKSIHQTIDLNNSLNAKAQAAVDAMEPSFKIWEVDQLQSSMSNIGIGPSTDGDHPSGKSKRASLKKALSIKSSEEKIASRTSKIFSEARELRDAILKEEAGRWPDPEDRRIVSMYQDKVGMAQRIADLRERSPLQYLHLLRAGYFEPIPVEWARQVSNPLKFSIDASVGWRGITPAWRGFEDTAEERLYWVLNHRQGDRARLKPDPISALSMARARMAQAVAPPPAYYAADDTCHLQNNYGGYSNQVMPPQLQHFDAPEQSTDDTMILLDVSGSMDFQPRRPVYNQYLITGYSQSTQPKNKELARAIVRRFTDAMSNHDQNWSGYELITFSSQAEYIGVVNHWNFDEMWRNIRFGGRTRVMTGWQRIKEQHFQKHSQTATYHPVYGWQAGPQTPMLRLLLLLDGEASDMDEFELDLLGLSWVHITIFLIGVDGCPHHHRHANELQRISEVNPHVSFVDAQGNAPERFITHELLKRHLGYELSMTEFEELEHAPGVPRRAELPAHEPPPPNLPELEQPPPLGERLPVELPSHEPTLPPRLSMELPPPYSATA
ncbi:uncharacterized protein N7482_001554 [Penicillium canariense]|uniref:VWFA domain-containing protein n=1 Tax=Penicillium canariense TaxID=189055 RepID=A0A9W9IFZ5_9EURO|nr:uncharacterized protein N7482_001554 [Penicillium canariense]KAJ5175677.1 hypothetical protein N7482_001554 [Penicillium canariense]